MLSKTFYLLLVLPLCAKAQQDNTSAAKNSWIGSLGAYYYFTRDDIPPTIVGLADKNKLHVEARYGYEDVRTASVFAGYNYETNGDVAICVTPMAGISAGVSSGFLPGLEMNIDYKKLNFYTENEYMLDFESKKADFFYSWTEASAQTVNNLHLGGVVESLRLFKTKLNVQKGVFAEYSFSVFTADIYFMNPFSKYDFVVGALTVNLP